METKHCECANPLPRNHEASRHNWCANCDLPLPPEKKEDLTEVLKKVDAQIGNAVRRLGQEHPDKPESQFEFPEEYASATNSCPLPNGEKCGLKACVWCYPIKEERAAMDVFKSGAFRSGGTVSVEPRAEKWEEEFGEVADEVANLIGATHSTLDQNKQWHGDKMKYWLDPKYVNLNFESLQSRVRKHFDIRFKSFIHSLLASEKEKVRGVIEGMKHWVFTPPHGLEIDTDGTVIPRQRGDTEYIKLNDLLQAL